MSHARVAPSALHLTVPCPGSLQLQETLPPTPPDEDEEEGTVAHLVAMKWAMGAAAEWPRGRKVQFAGMSRAYEIDDDMIDGAIMYQYQTNVNGRFEQAVRCPDVHATECWGTPDYWQMLSLPLLLGLDYKFGHRYVDVFENYQLIAYLTGVGRFLQLPNETPVRLGVVQPRAWHREGPVRYWDTIEGRALTLGDLYEFVANHIAPRVALALGPNPPTYTGKHCQDCRARYACKTLQYATNSIVEFAGTAEPADMPDSAIGQELRILADAIKRLEARKTGLYARADALARAGRPISFWSLQQGRANLKWLDNTSVDEVAGMGHMIGINVLKPPALLTPTQAIRAGIDESIILQYADRPKGALVLKPEDSTALRKIFGAKRT